jgi:Condensation domain
MSEHILVPFEGEGAGVAELSWGQRNIWIPIRRHRTSLPVGGIRKLRAGVTISDVAAQLQLLASRHQALRTRVEFAPAADRHAWQVLSPSGEIPVEIVDSEIAGHDPEQAAEAVSRRYRETEFDYPNEWPLRCAVITHQGAPSHLVLVICHLSVDGLGVRAMLMDLLRRGEDRIGLTSDLAAQSIASLATSRGNPGTPPLEQALWQASPAGQRVSDRALRHWERLMSSVPARRVTDGADPREPRYWIATAQSRASHLAARAIAGRLQLRTTPVLFAAYAVAFARAIGSNPVLAQVMLSNRLRPGLADTVSPVAQPGLAVIDVTGGAFDQVVRDAWRATVAASRHSYYDPYGQQALIDSMTERHGEQMEVRCFFNDRRGQIGLEAIGTPSTPDELAEALTRTTVGWKEPTDQPDEPFFVSVENVPGTIAWSVNFDTNYLSPARVEAFLREMEAILISAAFDPACVVPVVPKIALSLLYPCTHLGCRARNLPISSAAAGVPSGPARSRSPSSAARRRTGPVIRRRIPDRSTSSVTSA